MRILLSAFVAALVVSGCATPPQKVETADAEAARERCDVLVTGTRIPKCNRDGAQGVSQEEWDRALRQQKVTPRPPTQ